MKCSEALRLLKNAGWYSISQRGSHIKMRHNEINDVIIFPNHGSRELGKGLQQKLFKKAGINTGRDEKKDEKD